ncbi:MAG: hypothetical protein QOI79_4463, partial [Mycobacterium sp.]|nr:hypothetical protein [Mycobacterium sp.]
RDFVARARDAGVSVDDHEEPCAQHDFALLPTAEGASARTLITALVGSAAVDEPSAANVPVRATKIAPPPQRWIAGD